MSVVALDLKAATDNGSQQVILSVIGIPSALVSTWSVELPYVGRRGTLAVSAGEYTFLYNIDVTQQPPASRAHGGVSVREYDSS